jgi:hypothetical protein
MFDAYETKVRKHDKVNQYGQIEYVLEIRPINSKEAFTPIGLMGKTFRNDSWWWARDFSYKQVCSRMGVCMWHTRREAMEVLVQDHHRKKT